MKKSILLLALSLLLGSAAMANDFAYVVTDINNDNFWQKTGKQQEKVYSVAARLIEANKINKRVPISLEYKRNTINANSDPFYKNIKIYTGALYAMDNDDELAYMIGHEMAHTIEAYGGVVKFLSMSANPKQYELKADLKAIDYMVKAGYDPIAAIVIANKVFAEPLWDWGFFSTHPKGSKRIVNMYKYIYKKYPQYLASPKTQSAYYKNFEYTFSDELKGFRHRQDIRTQKQQAREAL